MAASIYKIWMSRPTALFAAMSDEARNAALSDDALTLKNLGAQQLLSCRAMWSSERFPFFGIELFPNVHALQKHAEYLESKGWFTLFDTETFLATAEEPFQMVDIDSQNGIFKLYLAQLTPYAHQLGDAEVSEKLKLVQAAMQETGVKSMIFGDVISSEAYGYFGLEYYPNFEAVKAYRKRLNDLHWARYIDGKIILGSAWGAG
jgi:hypothetical protein